MVIVEKVEVAERWPLCWRVWPSEESKLTFTDMENLLAQMNEDFERLDSSGQYVGAIRRDEWERILQALEEIIEEEMAFDRKQKSNLFIKLACAVCTPDPLLIAAERIQVEVMASYNVPEQGRIRRRVMWSVQACEGFLQVHLNPRPGFGTWLREQALAQEQEPQTIATTEKDSSKSWSIRIATRKLSNALGRWLSSKSQPDDGKQLETRPDKVRSIGSQSLSESAEVQEDQSCTGQSSASQRRRRLFGRVLKQFRKGKEIPDDPTAVSCRPRSVSISYGKSDAERFSLDKVVVTQDNLEPASVEMKRHSGGSNKTTSNASGKVVAMASTVFKTIENLRKVHLESEKGSDPVHDKSSREERAAMAARMVDETLLSTRKRLSKHKEKKEEEEEQQQEEEDEQDLSWVGPEQRAAMAARMVDETLHSTRKRLSRHGATMVH